MLCSIKDLKGYELAARDGGIGKAREVYFDDAHWVVRHLVADTGGWLSGRKVLISPHAIAAVEPAQRRLAVELTRRQIQEAPGIETDRPVSRRHEASQYDYYGYPYYWSGVGLWGSEAYPLAGGLLVPGAGQQVPTEIEREIAAAARESGDPHLRSSAEVIGYHIEASDGTIGHVDDFLFDTRSWQIRYAVVDTRNWLPGRRVLVSPAVIDSIDWNGRHAHLRLSREALKASPPYEPGPLMSEAEELRVQRHYEGWQ